MDSDAMGFILVHGNAFGHFRKSSDFSLEIRVFLDNLGSRGVLFQGF